jgi:hypothetical protein
MEHEKRKRGRPKLDVRYAGSGATSRRQALNKMYMFEAVQLLSVAATEIPNGELLWQVDRERWTIKSRDGILEQLGRMMVQDELSHNDCVYLANLAIAAVRAGHTTREIERQLRDIRMAIKTSLTSPESKTLLRILGNTVNILKRMGGME